MNWTPWCLGCVLLAGCTAAVDAGDGSTSGGSSSSGGVNASTSTTELPPAGTTSGSESTSTGPGLDTSTGTGPGPADTGVVDTGSSSSSSGEPTSGEYFVAFTTIIGPDTPFQFVGSIEADDSNITMSLTPLSLDVGSVDTPRELVPPPIVFEGPVDVDGRFTIEMPALELAGITNPITGSDVVATVQIEGELMGDLLCAQVTGQLTSPANIDLQGSTFSAMALDLGPNPLPQDLPLPSEIDC